MNKHQSKINKITQQKMLTCSKADPTLGVIPSLLKRRDLRTVWKPHPSHGDTGASLLRFLKSLI